MKLLKAGAWFPDTRDVEGRKGKLLLGARRLLAPVLTPALAAASAVVLAVVGLCALCVAPAATADSGSPARIDVTMHDFKIKVSRHSVPAGAVDIHVRNRGPSTHEINLDRTYLEASSLPIKGDGLTVNEDSKSLLRIDSIEQLNLGESGDLHVTLYPGHYVLYCNLEGHYLGGMHASFDVRPDAK